MSKHTPGPWKMNKYGGIGSGEFGTDRLIIDAQGWAHDWTPAERDRHYADASLIIAAPALLDALEWYRERAESLASDKAKNPDYAVAVVTELSLDAGIRARAAIAKATGEG